MITQKNWTLKNSAASEKNLEKGLHGLAQELAISPTLAQLLFLRGFQNSASMEKFLNPGLRHLPPLTSWPGIENAAQIISQGLQEGKQLAVWGDYDVDGITATAVVKDVLNRRGYQATHYIPDRIDFGYGLNEEGIRELLEQGIRLLLTVDCGIANGDEIRLARSLGMQVVITDHHLPGQDLPEADAIINPKLGHWPSEHLSGVGVSFLLMGAVNRMLPGTPMDIREVLDLVALGTMADVVPLDEHNRILVKNGLLLINEGRRAGVRALKEVCGLFPHENLGTTAIGFALAPRINAAGRIGNPDLALNLLLEENSQKAQTLAAKLDRLNSRRKDEERRILEEAVLQAEEQLDMDGLVLHSEHWHSGIIGIVASRIVERFHRPCLILTKEHGIFKGSGRSTPDFDLYAALCSCQEYLYRFGGHKQAAGLKIEPFQLANLKKRFAEAVREQRGLNPDPPFLEVDLPLPFEEVTATFLQEMELLQPFGPGNPRPIFLSPELTVRSHRFFGNFKHLELYLRDTDSGITLRAVAWRLGELWKDQIKHQRRVTIVYTPKLSRFNGLQQIELTAHGIYAA